MKTCFKCRLTLPLSSFYAHPMMADGYLGKCKECTKRDVRRHRQVAPGPRARDRVRPRAPEDRDKVNKRRRGAKNAAHCAVARAIRKGTLTRQPCRICGRPDSHAHHDDYSKPLDVDWLCPVHHAVVDGRTKEPVPPAPVVAP